VRVTDTEPFVALVIYPTTPEAQVKQADNLTRLVSEEIRLMPGFRSARVLLGEDGQSLVTLTEWSDRGSFESFRGSEFGQAAIRLVASLHPQTLWLREHTAIAAP
jgi:heme-degrading monooxygenase HmoA